MENKVKLVPSLKEKIEGDSAWCASFALVWKEFEKGVLENDFGYDGKSELVKNLIEECKKNITVADKDCYVKSGKMTIKLKKEIVKAIKKKFNTKSDLLDSLEFSKDEKNADILVYAIVMFALEFPNKFDEYDEELPFGKSEEKVKYFGIIRDRKNKELKKQVQPLFYDADNDFALALDSKDGKKVILYRTDESCDFETAYQQVMEKANTQNQKFLLGDVAIPNLKLDLLNIFDIEGSFIKKKDGMPYKVAKATQTLKFELNSQGAKVKSEAVMLIEKACFRPKQITNFYFNDTFYLYIVDNNNPIVAIRVNDIKKFK